MLEKLGWNAYFAAAWREREEPSGVPARVIAQHRGVWRVALEAAEADAQVSGKMRYAAEAPYLWPAVGDWVAADGDPLGRMQISAILPRRTEIVRKTAGHKVEPQVLAANVDFAWLLMGLDDDYNRRRLERYLALVWDARVRPVVILNKRDLCSEAEMRVAEVERLALGAPVFAISAATGEGVGSVMRTLSAGTTVVLLGSSGTGKSTVTNQLMNAEVQMTQAISTATSRGQHTTTSRQLFTLPCGAMLIDTPGLRELQLWEASDGLAEAFADIEKLARQCRFRDCSHRGEPGCAVAAAIVDQELTCERLESYRKLKREEEFLKRKIDPEMRQRERRVIKTINRAMRKRYQEREESGKQ